MTIKSTGNEYELHDTYLIDANNVSSYIRLANLKVHPHMERT